MSVVHSHTAPQTPRWYPTTWPRAEHISGAIGAPHPSELAASAPFLHRFLVSGSAQPSPTQPSRSQPHPAQPVPAQRPGLYLPHPSPSAPRPIILRYPNPHAQAHPIPRCSPPYPGRLSMPYGTATGCSREMRDGQHAGHKSLVLM